MTFETTVETNSSERWSVVMTHFTGRWMALQEAAPGIFGREGLDVFNLTLRSKKHLPAELADGLSKAEAERIVAGLEAVGAHAMAVLTADVRDVRHRAAEAWPSRIAGGFYFTEIDGMILARTRLNAREHMEAARERGGVSDRWRYERWANHMHTGMSLPDREHVREELELAAELEAALREAYPAGHFIISQIPAYAVSFWQAAEEQPDLSGPYGEPKDGKCWCQHCGHSQPYRVMEGPDAEFPQAEWGECARCGHDLLVRTWEVLRMVGPD